MNKRLIISIILVIIWASIIFIFSNMESNESNSKSKSVIDNIIEKVDNITNANEEVIKRHQTFVFKEKSNFIFRKICHASVYFAFSILVFNLIIQLKKGSLSFYILLTILICFIYAITDEYHQTFVIGRTGQFIDIIIDTIGSAIGAIFISTIYKIVIRKSVNKKKMRKIKE